MTYCHVSIAATESSQVGEARRQATRLATTAGLDEAEAGKVAIVAAELANNLVRYGQQGELLLRTLGDEVPGVELIAVDRGPGIANLRQSLEDGYSTGGTAGNGMGAIRRLSTEFDIYSAQPSGTIVFSRVTRAVRTNVAKTFEWGIVQRPAPRETVCGDAWRIAERNHELAILIADGLGHGPEAAAASAEATSVFDKSGFGPLAELFASADRHMRGTRGAAVAVAQIDARERKLHYVGVGNIAGHLRSRLETTGKGLCSHNGTVGAEMRKVQQFDYDYPEQPLLIMHSDGLQIRWSLENYPGLVNRHPAVIAAVLYRDFTRGRDDVTVCVVRSVVPAGVVSR